MKRKKSGKWLAALLTAALLAGAASGCGEKETDGSGSVPGTQTGSLPDQGKGRYVEIQEELPAELEGWDIVQIYTAEDKLRLLTTKEENGKSILREWEKQENGYADVTQGWLSSLEFACGGWMEAQLMQDGNGRQYLYAGYMSDGEDSFKGHLWKGQGDEAAEITPEKWSVADEENASYEMVIGMVALDNGTLAALSYNSLDILSGEDGSVLSSEQAGFYDGRPVADGENVYLRSSGSGGGQIEKRKDGRKEGMVTIPYPSGNGDGGGIGFTIGGEGSLCLAVLKDGTVIAAQEQGIFRLSGGAPDGQWERLVAGMETEFAITDSYCTGFAAMEDGKIYALFQVNEDLKLYRYEYDPEAVSEVTQILKLYTVYENSLLKQAAALYHKAHPETWIDIQYTYPMYYAEQPDYEAVYQSLNTMLMGDDAPDMVVMDHLNMDSYAQKGLLEDLDSLVRPMEESGEVLSNITGAYVDGDGKRYAVPLQFGFNMALGRDIGTEQMGRMEELAQFLAGKEESYLGTRTVAELVDEFYPYFCDEIVNNKELDREVLGKYLEYLKAIGDNCGIIAARPQEELALGMWDLGGKAKLAFQQVGGFTDCMFPMSMVDYIKGDFTAFENRFLPSMQTGICTRSQYSDTAKDFLRFALSQEVQDADYYKGFPVNVKSLEKLAAKDRSDYMAATMIMADDGSYLEFDSEAYPKETADRLVKLCQGLEKPIKEDAKIREVLIECLGAYLDGTQPKEDTIQKIEDGLKMYLAE